ncbi:MAG: MdtA/MuxA family multidrug efflux RND transporter periplasmic adaptor subunit [Deltaproteobacteria bacterium]|jgi:multidrug efflux system membrane fusion protein|nr:MdtA/MuxA family multidrug efflux RND transporter periplasmic adaptor subunit [Deltaproteobacteria bacterium]
MNGRLPRAAVPWSRPWPRLELYLVSAGVVFAVLLAAGLVYAMGSGEKTGGAPPDRTPPVSVLADVARRGDFPVYFQGLGSAIPMNTVTVRSRVDGELVRLHFIEGQEVKAGDLLAEIDPRPYRAELMQAEGQLLRDQALLRNAKQDLARYKTLLPQDSATPQQVDAQEALVRQYEAAVKVDQGRVEATALQLSFCRITAPIDGRLGLKLVDQGNMVRASDTTGIVVITQVRPIAVVFTVTEGQIPRVLAGMDSGRPLPVEAWDRTGAVLLAAGTLLTVDNRIDAATGTVKLKASFDNTRGELFPNQFVNARIRVETVKDAILAPTAAVRHASRGAFVHVAEKGRAAVRDVQTGEGDDSVTVITQGVSEGDVLIIDGVDRLRDGAPVKAILAGEGGVGKPEAGEPEAGKDGKSAASGPAPDGASGGKTPRAARP